VIRVILPAPLRTLANIPKEIELDVVAPVTIRSLLDLLEIRFPILRGTIRDIETKERRAFIRFFACEVDLSHNAIDQPLPESVIKGIEPLIVLGAIAGG
jgi:molybdopterin synthase sulfur carrier subunit